MAARSWLDRPAELKALDAAREADPTWFQSEKMLGGVCYVDLFAGRSQAPARPDPLLPGAGPHLPAPHAPLPRPRRRQRWRLRRQRLPHRGSAPRRHAGPARPLPPTCAQAGISLVLDFIFNHTSDEHRWAKAALAGDPDYADYYFLFADRTKPDAYERTLREIFPDKHPGAFTYPRGNRQVGLDDLQHLPVGSQLRTTLPPSARWPAKCSTSPTPAPKCCASTRSPSPGRKWAPSARACPRPTSSSRPSTPCLRIAAPSLLFKSEAIVHPDEVAKYIAPQECQLSYNPLLMALLWNSLATREVRMLRASMGYRFNIDDDCAWVNYVRCHDDIGWTFDDADAAAPRHQRLRPPPLSQRLLHRSLPRQLCPRPALPGKPAHRRRPHLRHAAPRSPGLEHALHLEQTPAEIDLAIRRICLLHAVILSIGGVPLIYLGDEIGTINDYTYVDDPAKVIDSRWVHRPQTDWAKMERRHDPATIEGRIYQALRHLIDLRKHTPAFAGNHMEVINLGNDHVFAYVRTAHGQAGSQRVLVLANFSEHTQPVAANELRLYGLSYRFTELIAGHDLILNDAPLVLEPYQVLWLAVAA